MASDDPRVVERLEPWKAGAGAPVADELIDFAVELSPEQQSGVRHLPSILHGSQRLAAASEPTDVLDGIVRIVASMERVVGVGEVRVGGVMPVVRAGAAVLVPVEYAAVLPGSWCRRHDITPVVSTACVVDLDRGTVRVGGGDEGDDAAWNVVEWWLPARPGVDPGERPSGAEVVALVAAAARPFTPRMDGAELEGIGLMARRYTPITSGELSSTPQAEAPARARVAVRRSVMGRLEARLPAV